MYIISALSRLEGSAGLNFCFVNGLYYRCVMLMCNETLSRCLSDWVEADPEKEGKFLPL